MEKKESGSGELLVASLKEKFQQKVPSRILRVLLVACVALLLCAAIVGIIFGCIAIGTCRAQAAPVDSEARPIDSLVSRPGVLSEDVALLPPTAAPTEHCCADGGASARTGRNAARACGAGTHARRPGDRLPERQAVPEGRQRSDHRGRAGGADGARLHGLR